MDPSDSPLEIALNAKKNPRFVLRLGIIKAAPPETQVEVTEAPMPNDALNSSKHIEKGYESSSVNEITLHRNSSEHTTPRSKQGSIKSYSSLGSSTGSIKSVGEKTRNIFHLNNSTGKIKSHLGMFFDGSSESQDRSAHHVHKARHVQPRRKKSFSSILKLRKGGSGSGKQVELSTNKLAPGVLKVFGDHVSPGSNYKSVWATDLTTTDEIVKQALERYSLDPQYASDYVLCDVIGYFAKPAGTKTTDRSDPGKWVTEYSRVNGDKERPLALQALWKPEKGFSRRFELRKKIETQNTSFFNPRSSIALAKGRTNKPDNQRETCTGTSDTTSISATHDHEHSFVDDANSSEQQSEVFSPLLAPIDTPYLLLLRGYSENEDLLIYRLDEQIALIGYHENVHDDIRPDIPLLAPDILSQHCVISKRVETSEEDFDVDDCIFSFVAYLEPHRNADVRINGVSIRTSVKLYPGDLISLGAYYIFLFKDATQDVQETFQFRWIQTLNHGNEILNHTNFKNTNYLYEQLQNSNSFSETSLEFANATANENRLTIAFKVDQEDDLLDMITNIFEVKSDCYKFTTAYLLLMCIEHSARHHSEMQTRQLMLKVSTTIQNVAWVSTCNIHIKFFTFTAMELFKYPPWVGISCFLLKFYYPN